LVYEVVRSFDGRRRRIRLKTTGTAAEPNTAAAVREARALGVDLDRGVIAAPSQVRVEDLAPLFAEHLTELVDHPERSRRRSERTVTEYGRVLRLHVVPALGRLRVSEVSARHVVSLLDAKADLSSNSRHNILSVTSALFNFAVEQEIVPRNVCRDLTRTQRPGRKTERKARRIGVEDIEAVIEEMGQPFDSIAVVLAFSGLRISECLGLRWGDIDFEAKTISVEGQLGLEGKRVETKTEESMSAVPLLPRLERELRALRSRLAEDRGLASVHADELVFQTLNGQPQSRRNALRALQNAAEKAGVEGLTLHSLRHSFGSIALQSGATVAEVAGLLRHSTPAVTVRTYLGTIDGEEDALRAKLVAGFGA